MAKDESQFIEGFLGLLEDHKIRYCVIGGQGVNAYVEPLVSLDLDIVVAVDQLADLEVLCGRTSKWNDSRTRWMFISPARN